MDSNSDQGGLHDNLPDRSMTKNTTAAATATQHSYPERETGRRGAHYVYERNNKSNYNRAAGEKHDDVPLLFLCT